MARQSINIPAFVSNIEIEPDEFLLPLQEVVVNSIQSVEDKDKSVACKNTINIKVVRDEQKIIKGDNFTPPYKPIIGFEVIDTGVGFIDERFEAFDEVYTDINKAKGCKGVGRYSVLACFNNMHINSVFEENKEWFNRDFNFSTSKGLIPEGDGAKSSSKETKHITKVSLNNYKTPFYDYIVSQKIDLEYIAESIIHHCLLYFLSEDELPLIVLSYKDDDKEKIVLNDIYKRLIKFDKNPDEINIDNINTPFSLKYIRNKATRSHSLHLCANKRQVGNKIALSTYIPSFVNNLEDGDDKYFLSIYITGDFLDEKVNSQRTRFLLPKTDLDKKAFDPISLKELFAGFSNNVRSRYADIINKFDDEKSLRIKEYILDEKKPRIVYRHLLGVEGIFEDIPANATDERIETELHKKTFILEQKRNKAFEKAFEKKQYDKETFTNIIQNVLKEEAQFSADKLADLMIRRKSVIKLFKQYLDWRDDEKYMLEEDLHNIIFTMGAESDTIPQNYHNLWLLDERLTFFSHTKSDKQLRTNEHIDSDSSKEPDLLIYDFPWAFSDNPNKVNSLVVFEFKRPGRDMNTKSDKKLDSQVEEYFEKLLESKSKNANGRFLNIQDTTPKFGYVICDLHDDLINYNTKHNYFKKTPHNTLYKINPELNMYIEVMSYETMIDFAEKRHEAFFRALGIENL
mgnify:CR=1 FL=1